jgi:cell shape-determining protein MreD
MRRTWIAILLLAAFVAESRLSPLGTALNLTVLFAYWAGLRYGPVHGTLAGAAIGAISDSVSGGMLGPFMLSKAAAGYLASYLRGGLFLWSPVMGIIAVVAITAIDGFIAYTCFSVFGQAEAGVWAASKTIFLQAALNFWAGLLLRPGDEEH